MEYLRCDWCQERSIEFTSNEREYSPGEMAKNEWSGQQDAKAKFRLELRANIPGFFHYRPEAVWSDGTQQILTYVLCGRAYLEPVSELAEGELRTWLVQAVYRVLPADLAERAVRWLETALAEGHQHRAASLFDALLLIRQNIKNTPTGAHDVVSPFKEEILNLINSVIRYDEERKRSMRTSSRASNG